MEENRLWKRFMEDRAAVAGAGIIFFLLGVALFGNLLAPYPYDLQNTAESLSAPGRAHWMGTDELGRDLFSRLIYGTRISMAVSLLTALSALVLGTCYGAAKPAARFTALMVGHLRDEKDPLTFFAGGGNGVRRQRALQADRRGAR